jgi:hypothetical protein
MQHGERDACGATGIDRIAAPFEDGEARGGSEVVAGGDGVTAAVEGGSGGGHEVLSSAAVKGAWSTMMALIVLGRYWRTHVMQVVA